jgi:hypothetical protein
VTSDPLVAPLAEELLTCLAQEILKVDKPPKYIQFRMGAVVDYLKSRHQDECCEGLAWVRLVTFVPSSGTFPAQDDAPQPKGTTGWAVTLEMGVIRCAPVGDENAIPTSAQQELVTRAVWDDAAAMRRALCCFADLKPGRAKNGMLPGAWLPLDTSGGCAGGVMTVTVRGGECDCADAGPAS